MIKKMLFNEEFWFVPFSSYSRLTFLNANAVAMTILVTLSKLLLVRHSEKWFGKAKKMNEAIKQL